MIYELSLVAKSELIDTDIASLKKLVHDVVQAHEGEVLIEDDWGRLHFAQPTKEGEPKGHFLYFIFKANNENNKELLRRFKINEAVIKSMIIKLGEESDREAVVKAYKTPFSKTYNGSITDELRDNESEGDNPKRFARRKACWFKSNSFKADWKDPATFNWLINEFGKISAARISGVSRKHQRFATTAIKRARQIGIASYVSSKMAENVRG